MSTENKAKKKKRVINYPRIITVALGVIIIVVIIILSARIIKWNRGKEYIVDPNTVGDLSTETEDEIYFLNPSLRFENADDKTNIVVLGNDTLSYAETGKSIADLLAEQTDASLINCGFTGSRLCADNTSWMDDGSAPMDAFSFYWLSDSIQRQDYTRQQEALRQLEGIDTEEYTETLERLNSIDFNTVDLLIIYYDAHDYLEGHPASLEGDNYNITTMEGSLIGSFLKYQVNYPQMQIMYVAPTYCYYLDESGAKVGCDFGNLGYGNLPTGLTTVLTQCMNFGVSYVDNFYGIKINGETRDDTLFDDGITPTEKARDSIAERISTILNARLKMTNEEIE